MNSVHVSGAIDQHFRGAIDLDVERQMRAHLASCDACHGHYRRRLLLAKLDPQALTAEERIGRALGITRRRPAFLGTTSFRVAAVLALAAILVLWLRSPKDAPKEEGFTARGTGPSSLTAEPASRVIVYRVPSAVGEADPTRVMDTVRRDEELAFAYENGGKKERLMVFGVDEHGHVYWFYPGWANETENPPAIPIVREPGRKELREAIAHRFDGDRLEIHALFVDEPLTVRTIEEIIARRPAPLGQLPVPNAIDHVVSLRVIP